MQQSQLEIWLFNIVKEPNEIETNYEKAKRVDYSYYVASVDHVRKQR